MDIEEAVTKFIEEHGYTIEGLYLCHPTTCISDDRMGIRRLRRIHFNTDTVVLDSETLNIHDPDFFEDLLLVIQNPTSFLDQMFRYKE